MTLKEFTKCSCGQHFTLIAKPYKNQLYVHHGLCNHCGKHHALPRVPISDL